MAQVALRFEDGAGLPLAAVYDTVEEAVRQGAYEEHTNPTRKVKDVIELPDDSPALNPEPERPVHPSTWKGKKLAGRAEVTATKKLVAKDFERSRDDDMPFHMLTSEFSWMNTGQAVPAAVEADLEAAKARIRARK